MKNINIDGVSFNKSAIEIIEKFVCPGCVGGSSPMNGCSHIINQYGYRCKNHILGTVIMGVGNFALGMPKGFNKPGYDNHKELSLNNMIIRCWPSNEEEKPVFDKFNVPVWSYTEKEYLFVRTYSPRTNNTAVDIVECGTTGLFPDNTWYNVNEFIDEID